MSPERLGWSSEQHDHVTSESVDGWPVCADCRQLLTAEEAEAIR